MPELDLSGRSLEQVEGIFGVVLANILANTLVELAPLIVRKLAPGGRLVLAGVLVHQHEEVESAYRAQGLRPVGNQRSGEWIRLDLRKE